VLARNLDRYFPDKDKILIFGVLKDKKYDEMVHEVVPCANTVITVTPDSDRALEARELAGMVETYCKNVIIGDTIEDAVRISMKIAGENDVICAFGSLYYIGAVRSLFNVNRI
jgi:dihydrofolate synthase/folylpolyglutamate synthase